MLSTGGDTVLEQPEFTEADDAIDEYMLAECGYEQIEATGVDYEYEGIPDTVPAGVVAVTFTNEGEELHEIGVARINDDVTVPVEEVLALPEEEVLSMITFTGVAFAAPGESETTFLRMEPGRYGAACFIPEGTTHDTEGTGRRTSRWACSRSSPPSDAVLPDAGDPAQFLGLAAASGLALVTGCSRAGHRPPAPPGPGGCG